jgi:hypothetical protein
MATIFKKSLFWDVPQVDDEKNGKFIIERVLNFGNVSDFQKAVKCYGKDAIVDVVAKSRNLDRKSQSFWCQYFHLDPNKCLKKQSVEKQGLFWKR